MKNVTDYSHKGSALLFKLRRCDPSKNDKCLVKNRKETITVEPHWTFTQTFTPSLWCVQVPQEPLYTCCTNIAATIVKTAKNSPEIRFNLAFEWSWSDFYAVWPLAMTYVCVMYAQPVHVFLIFKFTSVCVYQSICLSCCLTTQRDFMSLNRWIAI